MTPFDWQRILIDQFPPLFLGEVLLRVAFAFLVVFAFLKMSGRRGVRQISLFEILAILTLGSAAGDVVLYEDVPLLVVLVAVAGLLLLYRLTTWLMERHAPFGAWLEGEPVVIIRDGLYDTGALERHNISADEFFMELRSHNVEHLGQVRLGILEVNGDVSLYFFSEDQLRPGLSVLPRELRPCHVEVPESGLYACEYCGLPQQLEAGRHNCSRCGNARWSKALQQPYRPSSASALP
ncbi:hypothetical protein D9M69_349080 [compost metagenome]